QFDSASRGMRDAAQKTATDLDSLRQEMQRRMEGLPQQTAQATAAIRKALADQLKEIEAITPVLTRPQIQAPAPEPYRQPQLPPRREPGSEFDAPPFEGGGRPIGGAPQGADQLGAVTGNLAQQLSSASQGERRGPVDYRQPDRRREGWSVGDLLSNADA